MILYQLKLQVRPCGIDALARKEEVVILDICFGLGYNSAAAIDTIKRINPECRIMIYAFEKDRDILDRTGEVNPEFENYEIIRAAAVSHGVRRDNVSMDIFFGDARQRIREPDVLADAVFFDPFSPRNQPSMWTREFFSDICKKMKQGAILATYSCARVVRGNLKAAGFEVKDGPIVGRRSPSTIGIKL